MHLITRTLFQPFISCYVYIHIRICLFRMQIMVLSSILSFAFGGAALVEFPIILPTARSCFFNELYFGKFALSQ